MFIKLCIAAVFAAATVIADQTTYGVNAVCNNDQLMRYFDSSEGLWKKNNGDVYWWNSGCMLSTFSELAILNPTVKSDYSGVFDAIYQNAGANNPTKRSIKRADGKVGDGEGRGLSKRDEKGFFNEYYDDEGWWALGFVAALDATGNSDYLDEAISIWEDMRDGWNKQQCGGLPWNKTEGVAAVSIANELYIQLGAALSNRVGLDVKHTYLGAASDAWDWFSKSGLIGSDHLIVDGINKDTCAPEGDTYTYNQGVILGGLVELFRATGQLDYIDQAQLIADAVTAPGSKIQDSDGILADGCDKDKSCQGIDNGTQFKGVFARNLKYLHAIRPSQQYVDFIKKNAESIWQNDLYLDDAGNCFNGVLWGGPYVEASASSQSSALDTLIAATIMEADGQPLQAPSYTTNQDRANAVKEAFDFAWDGYITYAFPHDSLNPVDNTYQDDRNGWGASAIDAFSTAIIMENRDAVDKILDHIGQVDFDVSSTDVSFFETSIRYLAAMLSGYDLLSGPLAHVIDGNSTRLEPVLKQATHLADNLKSAYKTPSGLNVNGLEFHGPGDIVVHNDPQSGIAGITLPLEWGRLSDITEDSQYADLNKKAVSYLLTPFPSENQPFPGLIGQNFDPSNGHSLDAAGGWTGGSDSFYEYLIKAYVQNKADYEKYKERWVLAADSSMRFLASNPKSRTDLTFLGTFDNTTIKYNADHLSCFDGGNFILGGLTLGEQKYVDFGLKLTDSCHQTYAATQSGIGPGSWSWQDVDQTDNGPPSDQVDRFNQDGFWIDDYSYSLRPEVIESYYYAYRATGDTKYQDMAWDAFVAINSTCRTGSGFAELQDVTDPSKGFNNLQDTFFFAEVLKYSYIIHADDADWQVKADQTNQFVFNTEAHPIRVANGGTA